MRRAVSIAIGVISGLLCCALVALWIRSHMVSDLVVASGSGGHYYELVTIPGQVRFTRVTNWVGDQPLRWYAGDAPPWWPVFGQQPVYARWLPLGIGFDGGSRRINAPALGPQAYTPVTVAYQIVAIPFAVPALLAAIVVLWPWMRRRRSRRMLKDRLARGLCPACGYDLRASAGRCPECGHSAVS